MYVVVSARLNNFNNRISLLALDIRPITDYNEITFHLLDAIHNHVKLKNKVKLKRRAIKRGTDDCHLALYFVGRSYANINRKHW